MAFYDDVVAADSPWVWWKMNEASGQTTAVDAQGRANLVRASGTGSSFGNTGLIKTGTALHITNTATYFSTSDTDTGTVWDDNNTVSVEFWFYVSSLSAAINLMRQGGDSTGYGIELNTNGSIHGWLNGTTAGSYFNAPTSATGVVTTGTTYHLVMTWDGATFNIYLNNSVIVTNTGAASTFTANTGGAVDLPGRFAIGSGTKRFDEVAFYRSALTPEQVEKHYNAGRGFWTETPPVTNVAVAGHDATVDAEVAAPEHITVNADLTNLTVAGQAATVIPGVSVSVDATTSNTTLDAKDATGRGQWQIARPIADITSEWTLSSGSTAWSLLDEQTVNTADYIRVQTAGNETVSYNKNTEVKLSTLEAPAYGTGTLSVSINRSTSDGTLDLYVYLLQGSTTLQSWTVSNYMGTVTNNFTVSSATLAAVTDWSDLRVRFRFVRLISDDYYVASASVHWAELKVLAPSSDGNVSIDADSGAVTVAGQSATVSATSDVSIAAPKPNIAVSGKAATLSIITSTTVNAPSSNIPIAGQDAEFSNITADSITIQPSSPSIIHADGVDSSISTESIQTATTATITVAANDTEVSPMPDAILIGTDTATISVDAKTATVSLPNAYYTTVLAHAPISWYRMNETSGNLLDSVGTGQAIVPFGASYSQNGVPTLVGLDTGVSMTGANYNFLAMNNYSYELWFKTTDTNGYLYSGDSGVAFGSVAIQSGYLGTSNQGTFNSSGSYVSDGQWKHLVITQETVGTVKTYKMFLNGSLMPNTYDVDKWNSNETLASLTATYDEFAIYNYALTQAQIQDHYTKGAYVQADLEVEPPAGTIQVNGQTTVLNTEVIAPRANIVVESVQPNVITPGQTSLGVNRAALTVAGHDTTVTTTSSRTILPIITNVQVRNGIVDIGTMEDAFKFIPADDSSFTAADADELVSINLGALLHNQAKYQAFKMGNVGNQAISVTISVVSSNEDLDDLVQLSTDKNTYASTIQLNAIPPNGISDPIWFRLNSGSARPGSGTFLINVEQSNA